MKKILFTILIFLSIATTTSYAQIFKDKMPDNKRTTGIYDNTPKNIESDKNYLGFFRNNSPAGPGDRPGSGEGIGQAPIKDGILLLVAYSALLVVVKVIVRKFKRFS